MRKESDSELSQLDGKGNSATTLLDYGVEDDLVSKSSSQHTILKELNTMRIKSNRGRRRKNQANKENKFFKSQNVKGRGVVQV